METQYNKTPEFNGVDEQKAVKEAAQNERTSEQGNDVTNPENDLSLGNSIRNEGDVSGTTFGDQSNPAKFSNIGGANNQGQQGGNSGGNLNDSNRAAGNGGTGFSDYLYKAENEVVSGTSGDAMNSRPSDAMQGND